MPHFAATTTLCHDASVLFSVAFSFCGFSRPSSTFLGFPCFQLGFPTWFSVLPTARPLPRPWKSSRHLWQPRPCSLHQGPAPGPPSCPSNAPEVCPTAGFHLKPANLHAASTDGSPAKCQGVDHWQHPPKHQWHKSGICFKNFISVQCHCPRTCGWIKGCTHHFCPFMKVDLTLSFQVRDHCIEFGCD